MIAANVQAARYLTKRKIPALYRVHAPPPAEKYEDLLRFLKEFKLKMPPADEVTPADFSALLKRVHDRPEAELIQSVLLRSQSMAIYHAENQGHFGLALDAYAHFTSPIRRYPDLLVHRAIRYALTKGKPADYVYSETQMAAMAVHCSQRERRAEEAERDVDERFKCAWMEKHVGSEFAGTITGVTSFGLFVELAASRVSGLVHVSQLPNDYYKFDPIRHLLSGERTGSTYRLGDYVSVQVLRASMEDRKIDFRLVARLAQLPKPAPKVEVAAPVAPSSGMAKAGKAIGRAAKKAMDSLFGKKTKATVAVEAPAAHPPAPTPVSRRRAAEPSANEQPLSRPPRRRSQAPAPGQSARGERPARGEQSGRNEASARSEQSPRKATTKKTAAKKTAVTKTPTRQAPVATSETPAPAKKSARRRSRKPRSKPEA